MVPWVVIFSIDSRRQPSMCRHVPNTPSPQLLLFRSLTSRDVRNSFGFRSYANCPGHLLPAKTFSSLRSVPERPIFHLPYTLPSSVSCNLFVCHSYENCRGVYPTIPISELISRGLVLTGAAVAKNGYRWRNSSRRRRERRLVWWRMTPCSSRRLSRMTRKPSFWRAEISTATGSAPCAR